MIGVGFDERRAALGVAGPAQFTRSIGPGARCREQHQHRGHDERPRDCRSAHRGSAEAGTARCGGAAWLAGTSSRPRSTVGQRERTEGILPVDCHGEGHAFAGQRVPCSGRRAASVRRGASGPPVPAHAGRGRRNGPARRGPGSSIVPARSRIRSSAPPAATSSRAGAVRPDAGLYPCGPRWFEPRRPAAMPRPGRPRA